MKRTAIFLAQCIVLIIELVALKWLIEAVILPDPVSYLTGLMLLLGIAAVGKLYVRRKWGDT